MTIRQIKVHAAFSQEQTAMLRAKVLPLISAMLPEYLYNASLWLPKYGQNFIDKPKHPGLADPNTLGRAWVEFARNLSQAKAVLDAVVSVGSPAARAAALKKAVSDRVQYSTKTRKPLLFLKLADKQLRIAARGSLTPLGKEIVQNWNGQYMTLLKKSWPYIVKECDREFSEIFQQYGFQLPASSFAQRATQFKKALPGWSVNMEDTPYSKQCTAISPDQLTRLSLFDDTKYSINSWSLIPAFRLDTNSGWRSWARLGVDAGEETFDASTSIEAGIEACLEKIEKARAAHSNLNTNGQVYDFGPIQRKLLPAQKDQIIEALKTRGYYSFEPSGFGQAQVFTTNMNSVSTWGDTLASPWLIEQVGKKVWTHTEDRD